MISRSIIVPNIYDFNRSGMTSVLSDISQKRWRDVGNALSDMCLYWSADDKFIISPRPIDPAFIDFTSRLLGCQQTIVRSPKRDTDLIEDLIADQELLDELVNFGANSNSVNLLNWGATEGIYHLWRLLEHRGLSIQARDLPSRDCYWCVIYFDSKAGFRHFYERTMISAPKIAMPEGFICSSVRSIIEFVRYFFHKNGGCVIKANHGVNGVGIISLEPKWSRHSDEMLLHYIRNQVEEAEMFFSEGPIVVEELIKTNQIDIDKATVAGSVFMNAYIDADGQTSIIGCGSELRDRTNHYIGAQMGRYSYAELFALELEPFVQHIGDLMAKCGYRGHFGLDFLINNGGRPIVLELNPRRCSESPIFDLAHHLYGTNWRSTHSVIFRLPFYVALKRDISIAEVVEVFDSVNLKLADSNAIVVPICLNWLFLNPSAVGYAVIGTEQMQIQQAEDLLIHGLADKGVCRR